MAGAAINIAILADAAKAKTEFASTAKAADRMGDDVKASGKSLEEFGDKSGTAASTSSQLAGSFGDLGGVLATIPGPIGGIGKGMTALQPIIMGATGAFDLLEVITAKVGLSQLKQTASMVAGKVATVASTVATYAMTAAQTALNVVMSLNPIALVVIAIIALVAAFVIAYKKSETFRNIVTGAWNAIKAASIAVFNFLKGFISTIFNAIATYFRTVFAIYRAVFSAGWSAIKAVTSAVFNAVKAVISAIGSGITSVIRGIVSAALAVWNGIKKFANVVSELKTAIIGKVRGFGDILVNAGRDLINGLKRGIEAGKQLVLDAVARLANLIPGPIKKILGIASPSKLFKKLGRFTIMGFRDGFNSISAAAITKPLTKGLSKFSPSVRAASFTTGAVSSAGGGGTTLVINAPISGIVTDPVATAKAIEKTFLTYNTATGRTVRTS